MKRFKFYVYVLSRPNGKPFYVGKGADNRMFRHEVEARGGHKCHKCNVIRKIWRQKGVVQYTTVIATDDEAEAYAVEMTTIKLFGRENLTNQTDGGEGQCGVSEGTRKKISNANKLRWQNEEFKQKYLKIFEDEEYRAKISERAKKVWQNPEYRESYLKAIQGVQQRPEVKEKQSTKAKERWNRPEYRQRLEAFMQSDEYKEAQRQKTAERMSSPEARSKQGQESKARWADPEFRKRMMEQRQSPEYRKKLSDAAKNRK